MCVHSFAGDIPPTFFTFACCNFRNVLLSLVGYTWSPVFVAFSETWMCMSTASVESTVREGFDASGPSVHTILDL